MTICSICVLYYLLVRVFQRGLFRAFQRGKLACPGVSARLDSACLKAIMGFQMKHHVNPGVSAIQRLTILKHLHKAAAVRLRRRCDDPEICLVIMSVAHHLILRPLSSAALTWPLLGRAGMDGELPRISRNPFGVAKLRAGQHTLSLSNSRRTSARR